MPFSKKIVKTQDESTQTVKYNDMTEKLFESFLTINEIKHPEFLLKKNIDSWCQLVRDTYTKNVKKEVRDEIYSIPLFANYKLLRDYYKKEKPQTKLCLLCEEVKPISSFFYSVHYWDCRTALCKECVSHKLIEPLMLNKEI